LSLGCIAVAQALAQLLIVAKSLIVSCLELKSVFVATTVVSIDISSLEILIQFQAVYVFPVTIQLVQSYTFNTLLAVSYHICQALAVEGAVLADVQYAKSFHQVHTL